VIKVLLVEASEIDARQVQYMLTEAGEGDIRVTHVGNLSASADSRVIRRYLALRRSD
jgi:hypothetical protein